MTGSHCRTVIETVAEVRSVARERVEVLFHADERIVQLISLNAYPGVQGITWPLGATLAVIQALQAIVDAEGVA